MTVFDAHSDIWTDVTIKTSKGESDIVSKYHIERLRKGNVEGSIFVIWVDPPYNKISPYNRFIEIKSAIEKEINITKDFIIVRNYKEIEQAKNKSIFYVLIGIEGLSPIGRNLSLIDLYYNIGARHVMLTWNEQNELATGVMGDKDRGLTDLGKKALKIILEKKMIVDVSHLNEKSFWDVVDLVDIPIIASHSNVKKLCDVPRNLSDEQILKIGELNGVIGIDAFNGFIHRDTNKQDLDHLIKHIVYISDKIGVDHVGFGFDFFEFLPNDSISSFSHNETPCAKEFEDCSYIPKLVEKLEKVGFNKEELEKICFSNFHRIIKEIIN